ncbi:TetR/AcrR family transcriptional regulator [Kutzneria kofuensis]|uniref:TetR/AcrR family transcriptional regulator n=1 Tax=Kutzneria kofuensis TaxID=103725 RepID=A0A7W9NHA0_9PSEU|nr:TetR/AcrR family transcriptional regulator [Kutzneria kofuensis]MBB5892011.1 TetR/AcrR family transcriptional regulator [Kutzneria kofuensis]
MDSRDALLQAAAEEFARSGLKGTRIREIVQRSGVNERMIYHHFGSKEGLFRAVVEHEFGGMGQAWHDVLARARELEPYEGIRLAFATLFDIVHSRPLLVPLALQEGLSGWSVRPPLPADELPAELRELHERGVAKGVFRADVAFEVLYATAVMTLMGTPAMAGRIPAVLADRDMGRLRDQMIALLLDGLTGGDR